jgi:hypothetical protein
MNPLYKTMIAVAGVGAGLFALSGVFADSHGTEGVLGGIGWFGFLICVLTLIVLALVALGRSVFRRTAMS